jgi:hypothetical protein
MGVLGDELVWVLPRDWFGCLATLAKTVGLAVVLTQAGSFLGEMRQLPSLRLASIVERNGMSASPCD